MIVLLLRAARVAKILPALGALGLTACYTEGGSHATAAGYLIDDPRLPEISGLAASQSQPGVVFAVNDSGAEAMIHAISPAGRYLQGFVLSATQNDDWEAIASFTAAGNAWLLIGDIGDNFARRQSLALYLLPEPHVTPGAKPETLAARGFKVRIEDGPRDFESLLVTVGDRAQGSTEDFTDSASASASVAVFVLSKRDVPPKLYSLDLPLVGQVETLTARLAGAVDSLIQPSAAEKRRNDPHGRWSAQPTDLAYDPVHQQVALLTYKRLYLYSLAGQVKWPPSLERAARIIDLPPLDQAEGLTFLGPDCLLVSSEGSPSPLLLQSLVIDGCRLAYAAHAPKFTITSHRD